MIIINLPDGTQKRFPANTSEKEINSFIEQSIGKKPFNAKSTSTGEAVARKYIDTATFGAGNKLGAATTAGLLKLTGKAPNQSYSDLYNEINQEERQRLSQAEKEHPFATTLTGIGTGVATILPAIEKAGAQLGLQGAKSTLGKIAQLTGRGAITGAGYGAARGLGTSESLSEIPSNVAHEGLIGGGIGAATGGLLGTAAPLISKTGKGTVNLVRKITGKENPVEQAENIFGSQFAPEEAAQNIARLEKYGKEGRNLTIADVGGDKARGLGRVIGKTAGGKNLINNFLNNRSATSNTRIANAINKAISDKSYLQSFDDLAKARKELGGPLFQKGREEGANIPILTKDNANILSGKDKAIAHTFNEAISDDLIKDAIRTGQKEYNIKSPINSVETLHGARQVLDDKIGKAIRDKEGNRARVLLEAKNKLNKVIYEVAPSMKEADKIYAGRSALINAQELGLDFTRYRSSEALRKDWNKLTDGEKDAFKIGVADNLLQIVNKTGFNNSSASKIFGNPLIRNKLKIIFDSPEKYRDFAKTMIDEIKKAQTKQRILGNSITDINLADEEIFNKAAQGALKLAKNKDLPTILSSIADFITKKYYGINEKNAKELAKIIVSPKRTIEVLKKTISKANEQEKAAMKKFIEDYGGAIGSQITTSNNNQ